MAGPPPGDNTPILRLDDFKCPHCGGQLTEPPLPGNRHPRSAAFMCPSSTCPVGLFYVSTGAPTYRERIMAVVGVRLLAGFHEAEMRREYTVKTRQEAEKN